MRNFDFSSWQGVLTSIGGLLLITMIGMGIRLLMMLTIQQRRERQNRQINERLKALIAAYKTLGGSFTGNLAVNPTHMRDLRRARIATPVSEAGDAAASEPVAALEPVAAAPERETGDMSPAMSERARRIRDAVEASLSDIILFGDEEQVRLAARAAQEMTAGKTVHLHELVVSLRNHIRETLDLAAIPQGVAIPNQGPARPSASGGKGGGEREGGSGGARGGGGGGMGGGMAMGGMGVGMAMGGMGVGAGMGLGLSIHDETPDDDAHGK